MKVSMKRGRKLLMREYEILDVHAVEILDARAVPTLDVTITLKDGITGTATVAGEMSNGQYGAFELRDGDKRHFGRGVEQAVTNVNTRIADKIIGMNVLEQVKIDQLLVEADGTTNKRKYGANAILGVSLACARAAANALGIPLYQYLGGIHTKRMPIPMITLMDGGMHADNTLDVQTFMIAPVGAYNFAHGMEMSCEVYHHLKRILQEKGLTTNIGEEGGFAPSCKTAYEALDLIVEAVERAGYRLEHDVQLALNIAASGLYDENSELYYFRRESEMTGKDVCRNAEEMVQFYEELVSRYPVYSIEDGLAVNDTKGWKLLTYRLGDRIQLVGSDLFESNMACIVEGKKETIGNAVGIRMNQAGTLTETLDVIEKAKVEGYRPIINQCIGDTEDSFIADLAVAVNAGQIKAGAPCRGERTAKYNRLLKIEEMLGKNSVYHLD